MFFLFAGRLARMKLRILTLGRPRTELLASPRTRRRVGRTADRGSPRAPRQANVWFLQHRGRSARLRTGGRRSAIPSSIHRAVTAAPGGAHPPSTEPRARWSFLLTPAKTPAAAAAFLGETRCSQSPESLPERRRKEERLAVLCAEPFPGDRHPAQAEGWL